MGNIAAYGDDGNVFLIGKRARQKGVTATIFNKDGLTVIHQGCSKLRQLPLERIIVHHAGFNVVAVQWNGISVRTPQVALFFQKIQILTNGDFRNAGSFSAYAPLIDHHLQNDLLSGVHSIHLKGKVGNDVVTLPTGL